MPGGKRAPRSSLVLDGIHEVTVHLTLDGISDSTQYGIDLVKAMVRVCSLAYF